jgi:hypothetical protein
VYFKDFVESKKQIEQNGATCMQKTKQFSRFFLSFYFNLILSGLLSDTYIVLQPAIWTQYIKILKSRQK